MSPKALRRRGGLSALADTKHAVAVPLPHRGTASVTRELESREEPEVLSLAALFCNFSLAAERKVNKINNNLPF